MKEVNLRQCCLELLDGYGGAVQKVGRGAGNLVEDFLSIARLVASLREIT